MDSYEISKKGSIKANKVPYKTTSKRIRQDKIRIAIAASLATTLAVSLLINSGNKISDGINKYTSFKIVSEIAQEDKKGDLLSESTYMVNPSENIYAYSTENLAKELMKLEPVYFDLALYDVYSNMKYKDKNMKDLMSDIIFELEKIKDTNPSLYFKLKDVKTFEDYLKKIKCINKNGEISLDKYNEYGEFLNSYYKDSLKFNLSERKEESNGKRR